MVAVLQNSSLPFLAAKIHAHTTDNSNSEILGGGVHVCSWIKYVYDW